MLRLAQMAIAWVLRDPRVTSALVEIDRHAQEGEINIWAESSSA